MTELTVRAPGRVNLIGEHTDYMHLPVLPMAIQRGITIRASAVARPVVTARSATQRAVVTLDDASPMPDGWGRYLFGALRQLGDVARRRGATLHIDGDLPDTGGLSSSSALTTGVLKALAALWALDLDDEEIVRRAIAAERTVGVESGGMDQTVIMFAEPGAALRIDWEPVSRTPVPIAETIRFVIGYSGDEAPKGGSARDDYNERVVACRAAALLLAAASGRPAGDPPVLRPFLDIDVDSVDLPDESTAADVATQLDVAAETMVRLTMGSFDPDRPLRIAQAATHVMGEARRVDAAALALAAGDGPALGALFDESHRSLQDYGVSTSGLDAVTKAARTAGAFGARLTGAGFGGWAVAVCDLDRVAAVEDAMGVVASDLAFEVLASAGIR